MAALTFGRPDSSEATPRRGALLRLLDTLAEWQMRHSHHVISRNHRLNVQYIRANSSPVSSAFGYYTGGITGNVIASAFSVFF